MGIKATLKFIVNLLHSHKRLVIFLTSLAFLAALFEVVIPIVYGKVLDTVLAHSSVMTVIGFLSVWFTLRIIVGWLRRIINHKGRLMAHSVSADFATSIEKRLFNLPLSFHHDNKLHDVSEKIGTLRWTLNNVIEWGLFDTGPTLVASACMIVYTAFLDVRVAATLFIGLALFFVSNLARSKKFVELLEEADEYDHDRVASIYDSLRNILIVKSSTREKFEQQKAQVGLHGLQAKNRAWAAWLNGTVMREDIVATLGILGAVSFAAHSVYIGRLTGGQFVSIIGYAYAIFGYIAWIQWQFVNLLKIVARKKSVDDIFSESTEDYEGGVAPSLRGDIVFKSVRFQYSDNVPLLTSVSFSLNAGEQVAIVGESGEGKTTIVELLGRYMAPQSGSILIDGRDVRDINLCSLRGQIAYVPQDLTLFHDTIGANIRYGKPEATDHGVEEAIRKAHLNEFVAKLPEGLNTKVGERGLKLSAGERQRVALARAFLRDPKILILDEPTSSLDAKTEELIRASLKKLMQGRTTLIIAHRLRTIRESSKILVLKDGRIVEQGRHDDLAKQGGVYSELLQAQTSFVLPEERDDGILAAH